MTEMQKLDEMLTSLNIPHTYGRRFPDLDKEKRPGSKIDWGTQIIVTTEKGKRLWDAVCGYGSYGFEDGLLEIMGDIVPEGGDSVLGYLTADDVLVLALAKRGETE